ncbi:MAG: DNA cytosine methyltransferase [Planctomycetota bacterium]|nr:MAG: DNA cytosine methyltransferase [Planctomycetota bacterium]
MRSAGVQAKRTTRKRRDAQRFTAIDLFAGCGGLTSGLRAAGFDVLAAIEKDPNAAETYRANHANVRLYERDIRRISPRRVLRELGLRKGEMLDLVAGCPPCQGFTRLTEGSGRRDRRNGLVRQFLRFVRVIQPTVCMLENVPGLLTTPKGKRYFNELRHGLEEADYCLSYKIVELADYGVPQFRKRLVLLAARSEAIPIPNPTHRDPAQPGKSGQRPWKTVRDAIGGLPKPPLRSEVLSGKASPLYKWHYARDVAEVVRRRLEHVLGNGRRRSSLPPSLRLACHERRPDGYYDVYGVMDWNTPSPTITSGCTNVSKGRFGHPAEPRPVTAIEAAMLQTFPRSYRFKGSGLESVAAQIGNALPCRFAQVVGKAILKRLSSGA